MSGATAMLVRHPYAPPDDPYRQLFHHLTAGAAHCRLVVEGGRVVGVEILDHNAAFEPVRDQLPRLFAMLSRLREHSAPQTLGLGAAHLQLSVTAYPTARDHAMVVATDVTAQHQLAQRAYASQHRFGQVFHGNAAAMVIAHHRDLRIIDVNSRWLELFGATRDEVIGYTSVELGLITESRARDRIAQHEQFADGHDIELELVTRAGAPLTVLASARPIEIEEGRCTLTTLIDITGRKHAEEAFAVAFSASPAGMMLVDAASDEIVAVNNRFLEMTHDDRAQLLGRRASSLSMVLQPSREVLLAEVERSGRLDGVELELTSRAGGGIWTLASTEQITLHDKRHRLSVFTDITARKRLERRLLTQHAIGRHLAATSEPRVAIPHVLEALCRCEGWELGAMWLADADAPVGCGAWRSPGVDEAAMSRLGLAPAELLDRMRATGDTAPSLVIPAPGSAVRSAIVFPVLRGELAIGLIALASRDGGGQRDTTEHGLLDSIGRLLGLFVERTRAQAALRELNVELERRVSERTRALETSNRDLEAFSSSVSHDLRAPLRAIHGFAEMLLDEFAAGLPGEAVELLGQIHASSDRLRGLIEGLLAFARLGRDGLHRAEIELDPLVRSVLDELLVGHRLGDRLELRVVPLGRCHADPALLRLVWMNLLDNALKYARSRERIVIEIGHELRGGEILYYVRDNGVGFDMAHADRLFGVFQRLHTATDFEGTGLGLANVRRIIEHHRGRVAAHSELGRGSRFEFTLGPEPTRS